MSMNRTVALRLLQQACIGVIGAVVSSALLAAGLAGSLASPAVAVPDRSPPPASSAPQPPFSYLPLTYTTTNVAAGSPARYGLLFPAGSASQGAAGQQWIMVFDAELDVDAFQRRLKLCYVTDRAGRLPSHSRCVQAIAAQISIKTGPGEDRITLIAAETIQPNRQLGVWVDLINPIESGLYPVELRNVVTSADGQMVDTAGFWRIRVEQRSFDSPGSGD